MNVTLRQLRAFIEVAQCGSFTAAAASLHLTQSATSALVKQLEQQLGLPLLDRTTRTVTLTAAGEEFRVRAERILADVAGAVAGARELLEKRRGRVSIAASPLASITYLPPIIAAFKAAYPEVSVALHDMLTDRIIDAVRSGAADIGVGTFLASDNEVQLVQLFEDRLGVLLPARSSLATRRRLEWRDVAHAPRVALTRSSAFRPLIDRTIASLGMDAPEPAYEVGYMGTAVALVEAGLGVAILPERAAALVRVPSTACFRLLHRPTVTQASTLVTRQGRSLSPAAGAFVDFLSDRLKAGRSPRRAGG